MKKKLYLLLSMAVLGHSAAVYAEKLGSSISTAPSKEATEENIAPEVALISESAIFNEGSSPVTVGQYCKFLNDVASTEEETPLYHQEMNLQRRKQGEKYFYSVAPEKEKSLLKNATFDQVASFYDWLEERTSEHFSEEDQKIAQQNDSLLKPGMCMDTLEEYDQGGKTFPPKRGTPIYFNQADAFYDWLEQTHHHKQSQYTEENHLINAPASNASPKMATRHTFLFQ